MLPQKTNAAALAIYQPTDKVKAIDVRRELLNVPEVMSALSSVEKQIFAATTKTQIKDIPDKELVLDMGRLFRFIAIDVGYNIPSNIDDWRYIQTRLLDVIKLYYGEFSLSDIKLAFEMAAVGELDEYLPKDSAGNPDKKHYQQFNVNYFSKILNAYKGKRGDVIAKAYTAIPQRTAQPDEQAEKYYLENNLIQTRNCFLEYKYTGRLKFFGVLEMIIYNWLSEIGYAEEIRETEADRKASYADYFRRTLNGLTNQYEASHVRKNGLKSPELDFGAYESARRREIKRAFDKMIKDEFNF